MHLADIKEGTNLERHPADSSIFILRNVPLALAAQFYLVAKPKAMIVKRDNATALSEAFANHAQPEGYSYEDLLIGNDQQSRLFRPRVKDGKLSEIRCTLHFDRFKERFEKTLPPTVLRDITDITVACQTVNPGCMESDLAGLYLYDEKKTTRDLLTNRWHSHPKTTINIGYLGAGVEILAGWEPEGAKYGALHEYPDGGPEHGHGQIFQAAVGDASFLGPRAIHRGPQSIPPGGRLGFAVYY